MFFSSYNLLFEQLFPYYKINIDQFPVQNKKQWKSKFSKYILVNMIMMILSGIIGYLQGATAPKRVWETSVFISKFKFL